MIFWRNSSRHLACKRYLLDELDDRSRNRLEADLLTDPGAQEALAWSEMEIADLYLANRLSPAQRAVINEKFGDDQQWQRSLEITRLLREAGARLAAAGARESDHRWNRMKALRSLAFAAASVILIAGAFYWTTRAGRSGPPVVAMAHRAGRTISLVLQPAGLKGATGAPDNVLGLAPGSSAELRLPLTRDFYAAYTVRIEDSMTGVEAPVRSVSVQHGPGNTGEVRVIVDAGTLSPGRYTIVVRAAEPDGSVTEVRGFSLRTVDGGK